MRESTMRRSIRTRSEPRDDATGPQRRYDFHIHSRASDGIHTPAEILRISRDSGIAAISITDHDTVDAYRELEGEPRAVGDPWVLAGVELSTNLGDSEAHIIGYFPRGITPQIAGYVEDILLRRHRRIRSGITKLRERGIDISWEDCAAIATGRVVNLNHLAQVLVSERYILRAHRAYEKLAGVVPLPEPRAEDAVRAVGDLGGISVWAHPGKDQVAAHLTALERAGLSGVEVFIPRRTRKESRELAEAVHARGLLVTGGSDGHGADALGKFRVEEPSIRQFLERVAGSVPGSL